MKEPKKQQGWIRKRHKVVTLIAYCLLYPYIRLRYGIRMVPFRPKDGRAYLILLNHQTPFDQFFVGISFKKPVYYLATEDIFSLGWVSSVIRWLVAPIPIKKQTTDINAVMTCMRVAREGGTICIAPEGNRTYSGKTEYMSSSIAALAKKMKLPIALYRIEGGYGTEPRWSDCIRRGRMKAYVSRVIEPEEYASMTNDELFAQIEEGLFVDETKADGVFRSKKRAEYLERAMYVCPRCGLSEFESHGIRCSCKKCGGTLVYGEDKTLTGENFEFPFPFVSQWYDYQKDFVNALDTRNYTDEPMYRDTAALSEVIVYQRKQKLDENAKLCLYGDRITVNAGQENELCFPFESTDAVTVLGRNKLNVYYGKQVFQFKGGKRFNALKYVHIYNRHKNICSGNEDNKFLGL